MDLLLSFELNKPPQEAMTFYTNPEKFVKTHPVITKLEHLKHQTYRVHETLGWGPLSYSFRYTATIEAFPEQGRVHINAVVMKLVRIKLLIFLAPGAQGTSLREEITFGAIWPVTGILKRVFRKQHVQWFKNMNTF